MVKSPLDMPAEVAPDYDMLDVVVHGIALVAGMSVRAQHRSFGKRSVQTFRYFRLRQSPITAKRHVEVVFPVSRHDYGRLVLGKAFCLGLSATFAWLALKVAATFVRLVEKRLIALCYSGERAAIVLFQGAQYLVPPVEGSLFFC